MRSVIRGVERILCILVLSLVVSLLAIQSGAVGSSPVSPNPNLQATLTGAQADSHIDYALRLSNIGGAPATDVSMRADLLPGFTVAGTGAQVWTADLPQILADTSVLIGFTLVMDERVQAGTTALVVVDIAYDGRTTTAPYQLTVAPRSGVNPFLVVGVIAGAVLLGLGYATREYIEGARVDQLFLLHDSGMLIRHYSNGNGVSRDSDIMSGMLVILQEFVRDSFNDPRSSLEEVRFGDRRVLMARGKHSIMAAVVSGKRLHGLPDRLERAVGEFERVHSEALAGWNGNLHAFDGAADVFRPVLSGRFGIPREA